MAPPPRIPAECDTSRCPFNEALWEERHRLAELAEEANVEAHRGMYRRIGALEKWRTFLMGSVATLGIVWPTLWALHGAGLIYFGRPQP